MIGGGPQGTQSGMYTYMCASNDNADHVPVEDRYKYCDELQVLECIVLGDILTEYNYIEHVPSDVGVDQLFLDPTLCQTPDYLNTIALWTEDNLMKLNEIKSNYIIFNRARQSFASRFSINNNVIERKSVTKMLGVWLEESGGWSKNTAELCKRSYAKLSMLTKLKYAGASIPDLLHIYKQFIRS